MFYCMLPFKQKQQTLHVSEMSIKVFGCEFETYLCCLFDLEAAAARWAPGTLLLPPCHGPGHQGKCVCAGSDSSSCACC